MNFWQILSYAAWVISSISKQYDEDFLMSSREGADELTDH